MGERKEKVRILSSKQEGQLNKITRNTNESPIKLIQRNVGYEIACENAYPDKIALPLNGKQTRLKKRAKGFI